MEVNGHKAANFATVKNLQAPVLQDYASSPYAFDQHAHINLLSDGMEIHPLQRFLLQCSPDFYLG